jgi:hypothetical protein
MALDRNQFLLVAGAIAAATTTMASKSYPDEGAPEQDQVGACDGPTGQTGHAKYCPIAEGRRKGCLDWSSCSDSGLKAASELRYYDCLAASPPNACFVEGAISARQRCSDQVVRNACADPLAAATCQRAARNCARNSGTLALCTQYVAPLTSAGRDSFTSCMIEGCSDFQQTFKRCIAYTQ